MNLLNSSDEDRSLYELSLMPAQGVVNSLLPLLCSGDKEVKWRAVTALGVIVSDIAVKDMESAREVVRRLIWSLNEESGGIGWGAPEALGEIMASHEELAGEFSHLLVSYLRKNGNSPADESLQRGVVWGLGRLAKVRPHILKGQEVEVGPLLCPYLNSSDAAIRALAAWTMGSLGAKESRPQIETLLADNTQVKLYLDRKLLTCRVKEIARGALGTGTVCEMVT